VSKKEKSPGGQLIELVLVVAVAIGLALGIQAFLIKPYRIPSESMVPTLEIGQRVLVNRLGNNFGDPKVGDILVFHPPTGAEDNNECGDPDQPNGAACDEPTAKPAKVNYIKRVVGVPGDTISIVDGRVIRNGKPTKEPFIAKCGSGSGCQFPKAIKIPADHYFMMGDNRGMSDDSRFWGPVKRDWIIGGAVATYWPPRRINIF
jgi:signal peptidase I